MEIIKTDQINAPIDKTWNTLGPHYAQVSNWASAVYASKARTGTPKVESAPVAGRVCQTSLGPFVETLETYDPKTHKIAYSATSDKMPSFMNGLNNSWQLTALTPDVTEVRIELNADIAFPFSVLVGWMMKRKFNKALNDSMEDLKYYLENNKPHPRKIKIDTSDKAVVARSTL